MQGEALFCLSLTLSLIVEIECPSLLAFFFVVCCVVLCVLTLCQREDAKRFQ